MDDASCPGKLKLESVEERSDSKCAICPPIVYDVDHRVDAYNGIKGVAHAILDIHRLDRWFMHCRDKSPCAFQQILVDCGPITNALLS